MVGAEARVVHTYYRPGRPANWESGTTPLAKGREACHTKSMKKTTTLDMSAIMAAYTARVHAEHARAEAIREGRLPKPQPTTVWDISDRH